MAVNRGKFVDRWPMICAAGKSSHQTDTVDSNLRQYSLEDATTACLHSANVWKENVFEPPLKEPPFLHPNFKEKSEIKSILNPPVKTRYEQLLEDLKETTYTSYWNEEVGKTRDPVPGLPAGLNPVETTFGNPSVKEVPLKELINPPKTPYEVLYDSQVGHELYKKTHNDYNPSEQVSRNYKQPPFNPLKCYGLKTKYDPRGIWVRCCCDWHIKEPVTFVNEIQSKHQDRVEPQLGTALAPNHNIECVPKGHTFGKKSIRSYYGVEELLKDASVTPCLFKRDFYNWLACLNKLRGNVRERIRKGFVLDDVCKRCLYFDKEKSGYVHLNLFSDICSCPEINIKFENFIPLLQCLNIITEDHKICYKRFFNIINCNGDPVEFNPVEKIPKQNLHFVTTNQAAACDYLIIDNSNMPKAGVPTFRSDLPKPVTYPGMCRADMDSLGDYTKVNALINPSIYTAYGLNYRDFYAPRSKEYLRNLFGKIGYNFPGDSFEKLWKEGSEIDKTDAVCVETFKVLAEKYFPTRTVMVDELDCKYNKMI